MDKLTLFKSAAKSGGIARNIHDRTALQITQRTLQVFEMHPRLMEDFEIELPHGSNTMFSIDKMDAGGMKDMFHGKT
jgi:hypothetical protein